MKGILSRAAVAACILFVASAAQAQARGGRYDDEIRKAVAHLLASKSECKNVKAVVDDGVVTLTGSVELDSERLTVVARIRRLLHVEDVENQILLAPPAPLDNVLYARVKRRLNDAGYDQLSVHVHEGAVILQGSVRTERDRHSVVQLAWTTKGVKEVDAKLAVMQPDAR
ncbi:MAG TPA: BON domain-containing protein [Candidatus Dormibacteraeota bacterium]|nr:BON domain-containing protein [Candidatus Dormibacteraeota bacterium]